MSNLNEKQRTAISLFTCWWAMLEAEAEVTEQPFNPESVALSYMGCGASTMVMVKHLRDVCDVLNALATPPVASGAPVDPNVQGMADCMDMVRQELIEAGVIGPGIAPMFIASAVMAKLSAAAAPNAALVAALTTLLRLIDEFGIKSGVCCCGDGMERHGNPMDCGHSPVDSGEYYSESAIEAARAALAQAGAA